MKFYVFGFILVGILVSGCSTTKEPGELDTSAFQGPSASSKADTIVGKMLSY